MTGGTITGNNAGRGVAGKGGGVYYFREEQDKGEVSAFNVSGSPVIAGNVSGGSIDNGVLYDKIADDNVYLARENATWTTRMTVTGALTAGARIGVTIRKNKSETFATDMVAAVAAADYQNGQLTAADVAHLKSDDPKYIFTLNSAYQAELQEADAVLSDVSVDANGRITAFVTAPTNSVLIAASYGANGRMLDVKTSFYDWEVSGLLAEITLAKGTRYKLMLVDKTTYAPLCAAWEKKA